MKMKQAIEVNGEQFILTSRVAYNKNGDWWWIYSSVKTDHMTDFSIGCIDIAVDKDYNVYATKLPCFGFSVPSGHEYISVIEVQEMKQLKHIYESL